MKLYFRADLLRPFLERDPDAKALTIRATPRGKIRLLGRFSGQVAADAVEEPDPRILPIEIQPWNLLSAARTHPVVVVQATLPDGSPRRTEIQIGGTDRLP